MMQIMSNKEQDNKQARLLIKRLLELQKGNVYDGPQSALFLRTTYGLYVDWHETAAALDAMERNGLSTRTGNRHGMISYTIN